MINSQLASGAETPALNLPAGLSLGNLAPTVTGKLPLTRTLDEQADSAARKCLMYFGPNNNPRLTIGPRNQVTVDAGGKIHLLDDLDEYKKTVHTGTWNSVIKYSDELREKKIKIGFFSSTPQGGQFIFLLIFSLYASLLFTDGNLFPRPLTRQAVSRW